MLNGWLCVRALHPRGFPRVSAARQRGLLLTRETLAYAVDIHRKHIFAARPPRPFVNVHNGTPLHVHACVNM